MALIDRYNAAAAEVAAACISAGRRPEEVKLIAVSKTVELPVVAEAVAAGVADFGENRTQPFAEKQAAFPAANWHFIGQLQSRKAAEVAGRAALIHSVDRLSLITALEKACEKANTTQRILLEVNVSGEATKAGCTPGDLPALLEAVAATQHLQAVGLMTMAPRGSQQAAQKTFAALAKLLSASASAYNTPAKIELRELSMGMSEDFAPAIAEGATMVRIGRRIFSENFGE